MGDDWGGYRLEPGAWEFWQHRHNRLHDRFRYERTDGGWRTERLGALEHRLELHHLLQPRQLAGDAPAHAAPDQRARHGEHEARQRVLRAGVTVWRTRVPPTSADSSSVLSNGNGPATDRTTCRRGRRRSAIS